MKRCLLLFVFVALVSLGINAALGDSSADIPIKNIDGDTPVGFYQHKAISDLVAGETVTLDSLSLLVLRVSFTDKDFQTGQETDPPHDSEYFSNKLRQLEEYYSTASNGLFTLNYYLYDKVIRMSESESYYGDNEDWEWKMVEMLMEVVDSCDTSIDFSIYDSFAIIHAGSGEETDYFGDSPEQIVSGDLDPEEMEEVLRDSLGTPGVPTNDMKGGEAFYIDNITILPESPAQDGIEWQSLGIYAYQIGKRLGMVRLFDTTYNSYGIGKFGLMSWGLYVELGEVPVLPSAFNRYLLGWIDPVSIQEDSDIRLKDINSVSYSDTQMVKIEISPSEYFLIVNRVHDSNFNGFFDFIDVDGDGTIGIEDTIAGAEFDFYMTKDTNPSALIDSNGTQLSKYDTGSGLLIWHIDERVIMNSISGGRSPNDDAQLKGVDLEEADGVQDMDRGGSSYGYGSYYDSFRKGNRSEFGNSTMPSSEANGRFESRINITEISEPGPFMSFRVSFDRPFSSSETDIFGDLTGLPPVPIGNEASGSVDVVMAADTGLVYKLSEVGSDGWSGRIEIAGEFPGKGWIGPPAVGDVDGDNVPEIFIVSGSFSICALDAEGSTHLVDDDGTPNVLDLTSSKVSLPVMIEMDSDTLPEVIVLSEEDDSINIYVMESSEDVGNDFGAGVFRRNLRYGTLCSNPVVASVIDRSSGTSGFFYIAAGPEGNASAFYRGGTQGERYSVVRSTPIHKEIPDTVTMVLSAGDLDGDGSDELVAPVPGKGLVFWNPLKGSINVFESGELISPAALADIDNDGIIETAVRSERQLFLFTGFGVLKNDWPVEIESAAVELEDGSTRLGQPLISDIDGDGRGEILFNIGGNIYAYEADGALKEKWPVFGAGDCSGTPAIFKGDDGNTRIFISGRGSIIKELNTGMTYMGIPESRILVYDTGLPSGWENGWHSYRGDPYGTGRQTVSETLDPCGVTIDEGSFICYPNPVRGNELKVRVNLSSPGDIRITIFNLEGEKVLCFSGRNAYPEGASIPFEAVLPADGLASGIYICHIKIRAGEGDWTGTRKFAVVR